VLLPRGIESVTSQMTINSLVMPDGYVLPLRSWEPSDSPRGVVIGLHGFNDYGNAFAGVGNYLATAGFVTYAYDQRGFGQTASVGFWSGAEAMADDLTSAISLIRERHPGLPVHILGESMGGAVSVLAASRSPQALADSFVLSAPALWGGRAMSVFEHGALWFFAHTMPWLTLSGSSLNRIASDNVEMLRALGRDPLVIKETRVDAVNGVVDLMGKAQEAVEHVLLPTLVLYGAKDEIIPSHAVREGVRRLPDLGHSQKLAYYLGGYHMLTRDLQSELVLKDVVFWLLDHKAGLPSGADDKAIDFID
jgi:alpha-beta hydrolase superfamily lysophospholipase